MRVKWYLQELKTQDILLAEAEGCPALGEGRGGLQDGGHGRGRAGPQLSCTPPVELRT